MPEETCLKCQKKIVEGAGRYRTAVGSICMGCWDAYAAKDVNIFQNFGWRPAARPPDLMDLIKEINKRALLRAGSEK